MNIVGTMRMQTIVKRLNKCKRDQMRLTEQQNMVTEVSGTVGRQYRQLYTQVNGVGATIDAESQDLYTSKLEQLGQVYYSMMMKDNDIESQIKVLDGQIKSLNEEMQTLQKANEENAKKEVVRF